MKNFTLIMLQIAFALMMSFTTLSMIYGNIPNTIGFGIFAIIDVILLAENRIEEEIRNNKQLF